MTEENEQPLERPETGRRPEELRQAALALEAKARAQGPQSSYWPLVLAFTIIITLVGVIVHPILFGIGLVLDAIAVVGWGLERH